MNRFYIIKGVCIIYDLVCSSFPLNSLLFKDFTPKKVERRNGGGTARCVSESVKQAGWGSVASGGQPSSARTKQENWCFLKGKEVTRGGMAQV